LLATEHRAERRRCACGTTTAAAFPDHVRAAACYGPGVRALVCYLCVYQHLPVDRAAQLLAERELLARSAADHIEFVLQADLETLQGISSASGVNFEDGNSDPERAAVSDANLDSWTLEIAGASGAHMLINPSR